MHALSLSFSLPLSLPVVLSSLSHHPLPTPTTHPLTTPDNHQLDAYSLALFLLLATPVSHPLSVRFRMTSFQWGWLVVRLRMTSHVRLKMASHQWDLGQPVIRDSGWSDQWCSGWPVISEAQDDQSCEVQDGQSSEAQDGQPPLDPTKPHHALLSLA